MPLQKSTRRAARVSQLKPNQRKAITARLAELLADSYTLYLKTHNFHWNVKGELFASLHLLFEQQYTELAIAVDTIAERIRTLGVRAPGSYQEFAKMTRIQEELGTPPALDMVRQLADDQRIVAETARAAMPAAEAGGDEATLDLLTQRLQVHEKTAWMLDSILER